MAAAAAAKASASDDDEGGGVDGGNALRSGCCRSCLFLTIVPPALPFPLASLIACSFLSIALCLFGSGFLRRERRMRIQKQNHLAVDAARIPFFSKKKENQLFSP